MHLQVHAAVWARWAVAVVLFTATPCMAQDREKLRALLPMLPFKAQEEHIRVYSDLSAELTAELARHGERTWQFFARRFAQPPNRMEFTYVKSLATYTDLGKAGGWTVNPDGYNDAFVWDNDHGKLVLHTPKEPNVAAQLHALCSQALYCCLDGPRDYPWLYEGLCLYYQSAERLDAAGHLDPRQPLPEYLQDFHAQDRQGKLVPLARLLTMRAIDFDANRDLGTRAQSLLLMYYLMKEHPAVMQKLCRGLGQDYKDNAAVLAYLKTALKTDLPSLDKSYLAHARTLQPPAAPNLAKDAKDAKEAKDDPPAKEAPLDVVAKRFSYMAKDGPVEVYSDISKQFSQVHVKHLRFTWNYFARLTGDTPGTKLQLYYTRNEKLYEEIVRLTGSPQIPGAARRIAVSHHGTYWRMYILPYQNPDYETQLHEVSHLFFYHVFHGGLNAPWFMEGSGMYFECAMKMDKDGNMRPIPLGHSQDRFFELYAKGKLVPLRKLVSMNREQFYKEYLEVSYQQSLMLFHYLMKTHPKVMTDLFAQWHEGKTTSHEAVLEYLTAALNMDLATLEKRYVAYSLKKGR